MTVTPGLDVSETATHLGITIRQVYRLVESGELPAITVKTAAGSKLVVDVERLEPKPWADLAAKHETNSA